MLEKVMKLFHIFKSHDKSSEDAKSILHLILIIFENTVEK